MEDLYLTDPLERLPGVGAKRAALYRKLGLESIGDLLHFYPRSHLNLSQSVPIGETVLNEPNVIRAQVTRKQGEQYIRRGLTLFHAYATDGEQSIVITIFNSPWQFDALKVGQEYIFYGKVTGSLLRREMASPQFVPADEGNLVRPVYPLTEGLTNKIVLGNMEDALKVWGDVLEDNLPDELRQEHNLCALRYAMENIHFPQDDEALALARRRLIFEELLVLQLGMLLLRKKRRVQTGIRLTDTDISEFEASLPFTLTNGQRQAIADGLADMSGGRTVKAARNVPADLSADMPMNAEPIHGEPVNGEPMNRLLQGDVGSGKTMVAAALCYACHKNGYQSAVMAPTQILAEQHFHTFSRLLAPLGVDCELLTSGIPAKQRRESLGKIHSGEASVVIGTHALLREDVAFHALGLVVTDEQHRFGVEQRGAIAEKGDNPHMLVMSATPIPRTLAIIIYGDLDISAIRELPKGRQPIDTFAIDPGKRGRALGFVKKQLDEGRQAYIICPLIDENESELLSTTQYIEALRKTPLSDYRMESLNGRMKPKEKEALMAAFQTNEVQILVSTTVVEVGVDVPNANVILVENAERFGLSQLHQLRGRVGRGMHKSFCILVSGNEGQDNQKRLQVMTTTGDGFEIAEQDLKLRGPGDFFGTRQHGLPELKIANLLDDMDTVKDARKIAAGILKKDAVLAAPEHTGLREAVQALFGQNGQITMN